MNETAKSMPNPSFEFAPSGRWDASVAHHQPVNPSSSVKFG
jgi:hypothetical protein